MSHPYPPIHEMPLFRKVRAVTWAIVIPVGALGAFFWLLGFLSSFHQ